MQDEILTIIRRLADGKRLRGQVPSAVLYSEISTELHKQVKMEINELVKEGVITFHRTLNEVSFEVRQTEN